MVFNNHPSDQNLNLLLDFVDWNISFLGPVHRSLGYRSDLSNYQQLSGSNGTFDVHPLRLLIRLYMKSTAHMVQLYAPTDGFISKAGFTALVPIGPARSTSWDKCQVRYLTFRKPVHLDPRISASLEIHAVNRCHSANC